MKHGNDYLMWLKGYLERIPGVIPTAKEWETIQNKLATIDATPRSTPSFIYWMKGFLASQEYGKSNTLSKKQWEVWYRKFIEAFNENHAVKGTDPKIAKDKIEDDAQDEEPYVRRPILPPMIPMYPELPPTYPGIGTPGTPINPIIPGISPYIWPNPTSFPTMDPYPGPIWCSGVGSVGMSQDGFNTNIDRDCC